MLAPVTIREVMNDTVETIGPDVAAVTVAKRLHEEGIGSLVVVRDGEPVGMVTESDMARLVAQERDVGEVTATDCMSAPVITVDVADSLELAVELLRTHRIKKLPVLDGDDLVGIVTTTDVVDVVAAGEDPAEVEVADVMTAPVERVTTDVELNQAAEMMTTYGIKHLPVIDDHGDYVGMVSSTDVTSEVE